MHCTSLHNKTEVHKYFLSFFALVERQFDTSVKSFEVIMRLNFNACFLSLIKVEYIDVYAQPSHFVEAYQ